MGPKTETNLRKKTDRIFKYFSSILRAKMEPKGSQNGARGRVRSKASRCHPSRTLPLSHFVRSLRSYLQLHSRCKRSFRHPATCGSLVVWLYPPYPPHRPSHRNCSTHSTLDRCQGLLGHHFGHLGSPLGSSKKQTKNNSGK